MFKDSLSLSFKIVKSRDGRESVLNCCHRDRAADRAYLDLYTSSLFSSAACSAAAAAAGFSLNSHQWEKFKVLMLYILPQCFFMTQFNYSRNCN